MIDTLITVIPIFVAIAALTWSVFWGVKSYQNQMNAQLFLEFTKRFEEIMQSFPENAWSARTDLDDAPPPESDELSLSALRYLNLCSEEYYLFKKRWLHKEIWGIWETELIRTLQSPLYMREWKKLVREFDAYKEFQNYVNEIQADQDNLE